MRKRKKKKRNWDEVKLCRQGSAEKKKMKKLVLVLYLWHHCDIVATIYVVYAFAICYIFRVASPLIHCRSL